MKAGRVIAALAALALVASGCGFKGLYGVSLPGGADTGDNPMKLTMYFADALDLVPQSAVKVNDIPVGKVTAISLSGWRAKVTVEVRNSVRLHSNARAEISQTSLLGEKYVGLSDPLDDRHEANLAPLKSGDTIRDTSSAPEVEEVLGALSLLLNRGGLEQIRTIAQELNSALHGHEGTVHDLLSQLNTFVGTLDGQKDDIVTALQSVDTLAKTLDQQKQTIDDALDTYPTALKVLSAERGKLTTLLTSLSHLGSVATRVINATQTDLVQSLKALAPSLEALTSAGNDFPEALKIAGTFPFPLGTTRTLVRGDYANLAAFVNLDLGPLLCQSGKVPKPLCNLLNKLSARQKRLATQEEKSGALEPTLIAATGR